MPARHDLRGHGGQGTGHVRESTGWATSSCRLAAQLGKRCANSNDEVETWTRQGYVRRLQLRTSP